MLPAFGQQYIALIETSIYSVLHDKKKGGEIQ